MVQWKETVYVTLGWILTSSAIVGNLLVICLIAIRQRLQSTANWFVLSLAVADLLVGASLFPYYRTCKDKFCYQRHIHWLCVDLFLCVSVTNLCLMTIDRYMAIVKPLKYLLVVTTRRALFAIFAAWFIPLATALLPLSWTYLDSSLAGRATAWEIFVIGTLIVYGLIPCVLLPLAVVRILLIVRRCRLQRSVVMAQLDFNYSESRSERQLYPDREISSARLIVAVVILFLTCYVFGVCVRVVSVFGRHQPPDFVSVISFILILTNSAANPLVYGLLKRDLRRELIKTLKINNSSSELAFDEL